MPLSNSERQNRWLKKNRALHNLRRRQKRKSGVRGSGVSEDQTAQDIEFLASLSPAQTKTKLEELRALIKTVSDDAPYESYEPAKPQVFRDDRNKVITEAQFNQLQKLKEAAKKGRYELDDFSQHL